MRKILAGIASFWLIGACFASSGWTTQAVTLQFKADSVKDSIRLLATSDSVANIRVRTAGTDAQVPIVFIFVSGEIQDPTFGVKRLEVGPNVSAENPKPFIRHGLKEITKPVANIHNVALDQALKQIFYPIGYDVKIADTDGVVQLLETENAPHFLSIIEETGSLTCSEVQDLLRSKYGWDDGWVPRSGTKRDAYCICNEDTIIWDSSKNDRTVLALIQAMLHNWARTCNPTGTDKVQSFHIKTFGGKLGGAPNWTILGM